MKSMRSASLMFLVFAATLTQGPALLAAQRPSEMPLYNEIDRFLSPNELQLAELQRERQDLLESREKEKNIRILKNKITILNNKIAFLQRQIRLTNPYMVTQRLVPIKVKGAQSAQRLEPVEASLPAVVVPVTLVSKTFYVSEKREDAQSATLPRKLESKSPTAAASREKAAEQTLPVKIAPKSFATAAARETAQEKTELRPGHGKTGAEWKKMALADKEIYILSIMGSLSRHDVYLMKPYSFYIQIIDKAIEKDPRLEKEFVHRILMIAAYDSEPDSRKHLEKVWK